MSGNTKVSKCDCLYKCQSNKWASVCLDHPQHLMARRASHDKSLAVCGHTLGRLPHLFSLSPSFHAHPHRGSINVLPVKQLARSMTYWLSVHYASHERPSPFPGPMLQSVSMFLLILLSLCIRSLINLLPHWSAFLRQWLVLLQCLMGWYRLRIKRIEPARPRNKSLILTKPKREK